MRQIRFPGESPEHRRARALRERVHDLRDARQRIIAAADAARRKIERDLHDGAQQRLVALALSLRLARRRLDDDAEAAKALLDGAAENLDDGNSRDRRHPLQSPLPVCTNLTPRGADASD